MQIFEKVKQMANRYKCVFLKNGKCYHPDRGKWFSVIAKKCVLHKEFVAGCKYKITPNIAKTPKGAPPPPPSIRIMEN